MPAPFILRARCPGAVRRRRGRILGTTGCRSGPWTFPDRCNIFRMSCFDNRFHRFHDFGIKKYFGVKDNAFFCINKKKNLFFGEKEMSSRFTYLFSNISSSIFLFMLKLPTDDKNIAYFFIYDLWKR